MRLLLRPLYYCMFDINCEWSGQVASSAVKSFWLKKTGKIRPAHLSINLPGFAGQRFVYTCFRRLILGSEHTFKPVSA